MKKVMKDELDIYSGPYISIENQNYSAMDLKISETFPNIYMQLIGFSINSGYLNVLEIQKEDGNIDFFPLFR